MAIIEVLQAYSSSISHTSTIKLSWKINSYLDINKKRVLDFKKSTYQVVLQK